MGYRFLGGKFEETGLILLESTPPVAAVSIDGSLTTYKTPAQISRPAPGRYAVTVSLPGHRDWTKTFDLKPHWVTRAEQVVLLPTAIEPTRVFPQPVSSFGLSPDGRLLVFADTQSPPNLWLKTVALDEDAACIVPGAKSDFPRGAVVKQIDVCLTGRAALVTVTRPDKDETRLYWLSLREPYALVRVDNLLPTAAERYRVNPRAPRQLFALSGNRLCRIDVMEKTIKWDIAQPVETFEVAEDSLWLLKENSSTVFARPLNSNDPADDREVFGVATLERSVGARRLAVSGNRNAAVLAGGKALLRTSAAASELTPMFREARALVFSPDHLRVAVAEPRQLYMLPAYPLGGLLPEARLTEEDARGLKLVAKTESSEFTEFFWWADSAHLLVRRGDTVEFVETQLEGGQNRHEILKLKSPTAEMAFDAAAATLYFTDQRETTASASAHFLYAARLRATPRGWFEWLTKGGIISPAPAARNP
jgi:hypothetical protein